MSVPAVSVSPSPSTNVPSSPVVGSGGAVSLFGSFLLRAEPDISLQDTELPSLTTFVHNGPNLDPAMLTSPHELIGLDGGLNDRMLQSLTPGIPSVDILSRAKENLGAFEILPLNPESKSQFQNSGMIFLDPSNGGDIGNLQCGLTIPVSNTDLNSNILLSATGIVPSDIEKLKNEIAKAALEADHEIELDKDMDTDSMTVLVMFVPLPPEHEIISMNDMGLDMGAFSKLTQSGLTDLDLNSLSVQQSDAKLSHFLGIDDGLLTDENSHLVFSDLEKSGFEGSIASLDDKKSDHADIKKLLSGEMNVPSSLSSIGTSSFFDLSSWKSQDGLYAMPHGHLGGGGQSSPLTNPLFSATSAASAHPVAHAVAVMIEKASSGSDKAKQELSVQLDPPELGRMQIQLSHEKGEAMKVHLLVEQKDTLHLLQRDSHVLKSALDSAGIQMDGSSLTFDLASGDQSFNQLLGGSQDQNSKQHSTRFILDSETGSVIDTVNLASMDTHMNFVPNPVTGNIHYSVWA